MPPLDPSTPSGAARNLLFGILALQMDFIGRNDLITAMNAWVLDKSKPLGQILEEKGALRKEDDDLLEALIKRHLQMHGNNAQRCLTSLGFDGLLRSSLRQIDDSELRESVGHLSVGHATARFRIGHQHDKGGIGVVFHARDEELDRDVALKELQEKYADDPECKARMVREAEITAKLGHPGIVPVYGLGQYANGRLCYAMQFIASKNLGQAIKEFHTSDDGKRSAGKRSPAFRKLLGRFVDACNTLAYAHSRGVLHRDVKPRNVMLGEYDATFVIDWGLAKAVGRADPFATADEPPIETSSAATGTVTPTASILGTPAYMSPEQAAGQLDRLGPASDVYSLGATLYELLTGIDRFPLCNVGQILAKVKQGHWLPPRKVSKNVPAPLNAICCKAMARRPEERYASALELAVDIEHWLAYERVDAHKEPPTEWLKRQVQRRPGVAGLLGVIILFMAIGSAVIWNNLQEARRRTKDLFDAINIVLYTFAENPRLPLYDSGADFQSIFKTIVEPVERVLRERSTRPDFVCLRALIHLHKGLVEYQTGQYATAIGTYDEANKTLERVRPSSEWERELYDSSVALYNTRMALARGAAGGDKSEVLTLQVKACDVLRSLASAYPQTPEYTRRLGAVLNELAVMQSDGGTQINYLHKAREHLETVSDRLKAVPPDNAAAIQTRVIRDLGRVYVNLGSVPAQGPKDLEERERYLKKGAEQYDELLIASPNHCEFRLMRSRAAGNLGRLLSARRESQKAEKEFLYAHAVQQRLVVEFPKRAEYRSELAETSRDLGMLYWSIGKAEDAAKFLAQAEREFVELCKTKNKDKYLSDLGRVQVLRGNLSLEQDMPDLSVKRFKEVLEEPAQEREIKAAAHLGLALSFAQLEKYAKATRHLEEGKLLGHNLDPFHMEFVALYVDACEGVQSAAKRADELRSSLVKQDKAQNPHHLYNLSTIYSRLMKKADDEADADSLAEKAISLLDNLRAKNFFADPVRLHQLETLRDFESLRANRHYKEWKILKPEAGALKRPQEEQ